MKVFQISGLFMRASLVLLKFSCTAKPFAGELCKAHIMLVMFTWFEYRIWKTAGLKAWDPKLLYEPT